MEAPQKRDTKGLFPLFSWIVAAPGLCIPAIVSATGH